MRAKPNTCLKAAKLTVVHEYRAHPATVCVAAVAKQRSRSVSNIVIVVDDEVAHQASDGSSPLMVMDKQELVQQRFVLWAFEQRTPGVLYRTDIQELRTEPIRITDERIEHIAVSPSGEEVAVCYCAGGDPDFPEIALVRMDTCAVVVLPSDELIDCPISALHWPQADVLTAPGVHTCVRISFSAQC